MAKKAAKKESVKPLPRKEVTAHPADLASVVSERVQIRSLILVESKTFRAPTTNLKRGGPLPECEIEDVRFSTSSSADDTGVIVVLPKFICVLSSEGDGATTPLLLIEARFAISYAISKMSDLKQENFEAFATQNGVYNAWPYWREFAQSATARMGLGNFTIPVYRLP
jgi:hypothetical protein